MNIGKYFGYICKVFIYNVYVDYMGQLFFYIINVI